MQTNDFSNLPTSWQIKTLGEVFLIERGGSPRPIKNFLTNDENGINWIKIGDTKYVSKYIYSTAEKIKPEGKKHSRFVEIGDLILSNSMSFGHPYIMKTTGCIHDGWVVFRNTKKLIDEEYAYYALISNQIYAEFSKLATGSTVKNLSIDRIKQVAIPLPPLEIQKRIVARLESAFEKIEKGSAHLQDAKTKLAKYKQSLLKSAFNGTLTAAASLQGVEKAETIHTAASLRGSAADEAIHKVDCHKSANANFHNDDKSVDCHDLTSSNLAMTDKENPKLPQGWTIKTLGEIAQTTSGGTPSRKKLDYWNGNIKWLKSGELNDNYINEVEETITQSGLENSSAKIFSKGTLLIALYGATIGKLGILNLETSTNQAVCAIMPNKELETKYLFHFLFSIRNKIIKDAFGGAQSNISQTYLKQLKIPLPPLETQKQIVKLLEKHLQHADKTGEFIESALNKAKQLKQSLLKSAFAGELV